MLSYFTIRYMTIRDRNILYADVICDFISFQMLLCPTGEEDSGDEDETLKKKDKDKKYQFGHGITPPLKNARKRRFRKVLKKKYQEQPEIEKEVRTPGLFRTCKTRPVYSIYAYAWQHIISLP